MNVSGLGELSWKTDVFGVLGEFRSEFRSASAPLAQLVEQRTFNPQVLGSSPRGRTFVLARPGGRKRWLVRPGSECLSSQFSLKQCLRVRGQMHRCIPQLFRISAHKYSCTQVK